MEYLTRHFIEDRDSVKDRSLVCKGEVNNNLTEQMWFVFKAKMTTMPLQYSS
jgi:hypothetical protein